MHLTILGLFFLTLSTLPSFAACEFLSILDRTENYQAVQDQGSLEAYLTKNIAKCLDETVQALVRDSDTIARARPVKNAAQIAGFWVNDYWLPVEKGLTVPFVETLGISANNRIERRVLRWVDPLDVQHIAPRAAQKKTKMVVPEYHPLAVSGNISIGSDGQAVINEYTEFKVTYFESPLKRNPIYKIGESLHNTAFPDLSRSFIIAVDDDVLMISDQLGKVRTYRRYGRKDVERMHALILEAQISAGSNWKCLLKKVNFEKVEDSNLRKAGDYSLTALSIKQDMAKMEAKAYNAALLNPKVDPWPPQNTYRALHIKMLKARENPINQWITEQMSGSSPFGCQSG